MRKFLTLLPLIVLLGGCVTHYYPAPGTEAVEEEAYTQREPAYRPRARTYVGASFYPYWSIDYFYLGYGYGRSSFAFGVGWNVWSPWYTWYPAWYYRPWAYVSYPIYAYYPTYYAGWNDYYWRHKWHRHGYSHHGGRHGYDRGYWAGGHYGSGGRDVGRHRDHAPDYDYSGYREPGYAGAGSRRPGQDRPPRRYEDSDDGRRVVRRPNGENRVPTQWRTRANGQQDMVVRSRGNDKPGKSRTQPVRRSPSTSPVRAVDAPSSRRVLARSPGYVDVPESHRADRVRSRGNDKPGPSRTEPVGRRSLATKPAVRSPSGPVQRQPVQRQPVQRQPVQRRTPPPVPMSAMKPPARDVRSAPGYKMPVPRTQPVARPSAPPSRVGRPAPSREARPVTRSERPSRPVRRAPKADRPSKGGRARASRAD